MVHKEKYQMAADKAAQKSGLYALHIGKIGDDTFVYSALGANSADSNSDNPTVICVKGDGTKIYSGQEAADVIAEMKPREFSTGRAIYKKYQTLVKNKSAVIGEGPAYAQAIVDAVANKQIKASLLYQYLELAEHYHKKLAIEGGTIRLI